MVTYIDKSGLDRHVEFGGRYRGGIEMNKFGIRITPSSILLSAPFLPVIHQDINPYIDAGTGSLIIQFLIAGAIGGLFLVRTYWRKIRAFFNNHFSKLRKGKG